MDSAIDRFTELFAESFAALSIGVSDHMVEELARVVDESMSGGRRRYHRPPHVLDLIGGLSPQTTLATLFHDVVYWQLDDGFPTRAQSLLSPIVRFENDRFFLIPTPVDDPMLAACIALFGLQPDSELKLFSGMNEFLSAVVAVRLLQAHVPLRDLLVVAACIEATIPFRGPLADGKSAFDARAERLAAVSDRWNAGLSAADVERAMTDAVVLANRDVASFGESAPATFLASTWLLIEESNAPLREVDAYSFRDYHVALVRMEGFLRNLDADHIFHRYGDTPNLSELAALRQTAERNLEFSCSYLEAKLLGTAVVEAVALQSGGDCPIASFLGALHETAPSAPRVEDFLPSTPGFSAGTPLLQVLESGRAWESEADLNRSPISAFVHRSLGIEKSRTALAEARRMFAGECSPLDFLRSVGALDPRLVPAVVGACARIATSRTRNLDALLRDLQG